MFEFFRKLAPEAGAEELRAALAKADPEVAQRELENAKRARTAMLLTGTDADIAKAEAAIEGARIRFDRIEAAREEIENRLAALEVEERERGLLDAHAAADKALADMRKRFLNEGAKAAKALDALLDAVEESDRLYRHSYDGQMRNQGAFPAVDSLPPLLRIRDWIDRDEAAAVPQTLKDLVFRRFRF